MKINQKIYNMFVLHVSGTSARNRSPSTIALELFEQHQGTHILQVSNEIKIRLKTT